MAEQSNSERKNIVLGITGSIAAYKGVELARLLTLRGYQVRAIMTEAAKQFVGPLTLQSVTGHPVVTSMWDESELQGIGHIDLADWADALVIAPATADTIAQLAAGSADGPLCAVALATKAPLLLAPAMNVNMYEHPATQHNLSILRTRGVQVVDPEVGSLACGWNGAGRLAAPEEIVSLVRRLVSSHDLAGRRVLIVTGPTREAIDPVRFLSNRSSGKMGVALAREAFRRGAEVTLIHGPLQIRLPNLIKCISVTTAAEMHSAVMDRAFAEEGSPDIVIMAAAVADVRPATVAPHKIKKHQMPLTMALERTRDILADVGERRADAVSPRLVGFAVETGELDELLEQVRDKLARKRCDLMVGNLAADAFELDTNRVWLVDKGGRQEEISTSSKSRIANRILDAVLRL